MKAITSGLATGAAGVGTAWGTTRGKEGEGGGGGGGWAGAEGEEKDEG